MATAANFTSIPTLNYDLLASPDTRPSFIQQLQDALINVGFLYLEHPPIPTSLIDEVVAYLPRLFALPQARKDALRMANSPHFLGYSRLGVERTKGVADQREQFDIATPLGADDRWTPGEPEYLRLWGPSQWPEEEDVPGFKAAFVRYLAAVENLSHEFVQLVAESLGLAPDGLARFFDARERMQHRSKIVKYPTRDEVASEQGVGPHFDAGFLTFLLQASDHPGLQVQNLSGQWIDVPPRPYTFVINFGKGLESVTQGLARATSHRVLAPPAGTSPRYSIPFFQNIAQDVRLSEHVLEFPPEVLKLKGQRGELGQTDSVNFSEYDSLPSGQVSLINRVKSHPDVAEKHYPDLFKRFFPYGMPTHGTAY
ncbi:Clavaminate synthase-like protein [Lactarius deliciosus]|nr:Clavaminate synthase-like protein [Lactarius deliciosus]